MRTLREYFDNDFTNTSLSSEVIITINNTQEHFSSSKTLTVSKKVIDDLQDSCRLLTYYMVPDEDIFDVLKTILNNLEDQIAHCENIYSIQNYPKDLNFGTHKNIYSNRIYFYTEPILTQKEKDTIDLLCTKKNIYLTIRGTEYMEARLNL